MAHLLQFNNRKMQSADEETIPIYSAGSSECDTDLSAAGSLSRLSVGADS